MTGIAHPPAAAAYTLSSGRTCRVVTRDLPLLGRYLVLSCRESPESPTPREEEELLVLACREGRRLALSRFGTAGCFTLVFSGERNRRRPWPHVHVLAARDVRAKRRALFLYPLRRLLAWWATDPRPAEAISVEALPPPPLGRPLLEDLVRRYAEPHRRYHDLSHVEEMLRRGLDIGLTPEQEAAVWFHDAVYQPGARNNETRSARLAATALAGEGWSACRIEVVRRIILDTADHRSRFAPSAAVLDLDLARLAKSPAECVVHAEQLRQEYAAIATPAAWKAGRAAFLRRMLARERLFDTPWGRVLEERARTNLRRELEEIETRP